MLHLRDIAWMRLQWKRFKRLLGGATGLVWLLFSSGVLFLPEEEDGETWFWARISLLVCLVLSTIVSVWLFFAARREIKRLEGVSADMRIEQAEALRARKAGRGSK